MSTKNAQANSTVENTALATENKSGKNGKRARNAECVGQESPSALGLAQSNSPSTRTSAPHIIQYTSATYSFRDPLRETYTIRRKILKKRREKRHRDKR